MDKEWLIKWLDARFGHRDFSVLSRKGKIVHYESVAREIILMIELETEQLDNDNIVFNFPSKTARKGKIVYDK